MRRLFVAWYASEPWLRRFATANLMASCLATAGLAIAMVASGSPTIRADFLIMVVAVSVQVLGALLVPPYGDTAVVLTMLASASVAAVGATWVTPFLSPLGVVVLLLPVLAAYPYLSRRWMLAVVGYAVVMTSVVAGMAEWRRPEAAHVPVLPATISVMLAVPSVTVIVAYAVLQNYARLWTQAEELRESQRRAAELADAARRSLERDLHDGAQQSLVAMTVQIARIRSLLDKGAVDAGRSALDELAATNLEALQELRELARGIYPPLLAERGLVPAVAAACRRSPLQVELDADGVGRHSHETESAAYFCIQEAVANAAKHSGATAVTVRITDGPRLRFEVTDDGLGFDPATVSSPGGLLGMRARVEAAGGRLTVRSSPGEGTRIRGTFPQS